MSYIVLLIDYNNDTIMEGSVEMQEELQQKRLQLKTLQEKCELQNKKIKLYRKDNEEIKQALVRQAQIDTSLLLNSKELSDANAKLEAAIHDISLKLELDLDSLGNAPLAKVSRPVSLVTIQNITVTDETEEIDLPSQEIGDKDVLQLQSFRGLKSLILGDNKIGDAGIKTITDCLINVKKLQLNNNKFTASSLANIGNLKELKVLDLRTNNLGDGFLICLSNLVSLQELSISKNIITDSGLTHLSALLSLFYLDLTTNLITDQGIKHLQPLQKLSHLYLMSNRITETGVFFVYEHMSKLQVFDVRFNINDNAKRDLLRASKPEKLQLFC